MNPRIRYWLFKRNLIGWLMLAGWIALIVFLLIHSSGSCPFTWDGPCP